MSLIFFDKKTGKINHSPANIDQYATEQYATIDLKLITPESHVLFQTDNYIISPIYAYIEKEETSFVVLKYNGNDGVYNYNKAELIKFFSNYSNCDKLHSHLKDGEKYIISYPSKLKYVVYQELENRPGPENQLKIDDVKPDNKPNKQENIIPGEKSKDTLVKKVTYNILAKKAIKASAQLAAPQIGKISEKLIPGSRELAEEIAKSDLGQGIMGLPASQVLPKLLPVSEEKKEKLKDAMAEQATEKIAETILQPFSEWIYSELVNLNKKRLIRTNSKIRIEVDSSESEENENFKLKEAKC